MAYLTENFAPLLHTHQPGPQISDRQYRSRSLVIQAFGTSLLRVPELRRVIRRRPASRYQTAKSVLLLWLGPAVTVVANISVTVSSNEVQHTLIQKSLCQQVLPVVPPAG
jgi:hypothetical protein